MPGGQPDFSAGATRSRGGISIIALRASTRGNSNIVAAFEADTPITGTADVVSYVVTEHGIARIRDASPAQRAAALVGVAAPVHRDELARQDSLRGH